MKLEALQMHLEENRRFIQEADSAAMLNSGKKDWKPIKGLYSMAYLAPLAVLYHPLIL